MFDDLDSQTELKVVDDTQKAHYDLIIVGGGPAGMTAAIAAVQNGMKAILIEKAVLGGRIHTIGSVQNYMGLSGDISGEELSRNMEEQVKGSNIDIAWEDVSSINVIDSFVFVRTNLNKLFTAPYAIIGTGLSPKKLGIPGEESFFGRGVSYSAVVDKDYFRGKTVAIIGGGNYAVAQALYLENVASKVKVVYRGKELKALLYYKEQLLNSNSFETHLSVHVDEIYGGRTVEGVKCTDQLTNSECRIQADSVIVCTGMYPKTGMLADILRVDERGFIETDECMCSSNPRIYAIGDVRSKLLRQIVTASSDGLIAVKAIFERM